MTSSSPKPTETLRCPKKIYGILLMSLKCKILELEEYSIFHMILMTRNILFSFQIYSINKALNLTSSTISFTYLQKLEWVCRSLRV